MSVDVAYICEGNDWDKSWISRILIGYEELYALLDRHAGEFGPFA
jgi:hypothetical protein